MSALLDPQAVATALERMKSGAGTDKDFSVILAGATAYSEGTVEWGFESPQPGLMYATSNDMLIETMSGARPEATVYARIGLPWQDERGDRRTGP